MTYLEIARAALVKRETSERSEKSPLLQTVGQGDERPTCEKRSAGGETSPLLMPEEAEELKAQIIAAVTVEPAVFDRALYEELTARWDAHEAALNQLKRSLAPVVTPMAASDSGVVAGNSLTTWEPCGDRRAK